MTPENDTPDLTLIGKWQTWSPYLQSVLRIVAAILFMLAGMAKIFAFPVGLPPNGSTAEIFSQIWFAGMLEVCGGALLLVGFCTRPISFLLAGEMAVAYFQFHFPRGFWPTVNNGVPAILYCFIWLYFSAAGAGPLSLDAKRRKKV